MFCIRTHTLLRGVGSQEAINITHENIKENVNKNKIKEEEFGRISGEGGSTKQE